MFGKYGVPIDYVQGRGRPIQPKQQFKFRVRLIAFGGLENEAPHGMDITKNVVSVQKPSISFPKIEVKTYSGTMKTFNTPTINGLRLTVRDDLDNSVLIAINRQLSKQYDFVNGRHAYASSNAKFTLLIETLDGQNTDKAVDAWRLDNCFIESIEYGENNYSSGDATQISMNIEFDFINSHYIESGSGRDSLDTLWYVTSKGTETI